MRGQLLSWMGKDCICSKYMLWANCAKFNFISNITCDHLLFSAMSTLTKSMCWKMVNKTKDKLNQVGMVIYQKPMDNICYEKRTENSPPLCKESDDADAAWYGFGSLRRIYFQCGKVLLCFAYTTF